MPASRCRRTVAGVLGTLVALTLSAACSLVIKDPIAVLGNPTVPADRTFSKAEAIEDVNGLMQILEHVHADPFRLRPRSEVDGERRRLIDTMPASLTTTELCVRLSRLAAAIQDGHTSMSCERLIVRNWRAAARAAGPQSQPLKMFPPYMGLDDQRHLIVLWPNDAPGVERGDLLLRVNGRDADALMAEWEPEVSHDTDAGRRAAIARSFRLQLALHGIDAPYRVTVAAPGAASREVLVQGEPVNYLFQSRPTPAPVPTVAPTTAAAPRTASALPPSDTPTAVKPIELQTGFFKYRVIAPGIAYMDFFSIFDGLDTQSRFRKAVDTMFERVASDEPRVLIIDIRENGGGEDQTASELLRHITEKPFRLVASTQVKRSAEVRALGKSMIRIPFRWFGLQYLVSEARDYYTGEVGSLSTPDERPVETLTPAKPFFAGPVCVLTGPHTFSAAAELAEAVKTYGLATIVGEETGGQPNSFGNDIPFALPRSGLPVNIATARGMRANGDPADFSSVKPDIVVRATAADIRLGFDPVLERAKSCPARSVR